MLPSVRLLIVFAHQLARSFSLAGFHLFCCLCDLWVCPCHRELYSIGNCQVKQARYSRNHLMSFRCKANRLHNHSFAFLDFCHLSIPKITQICILGKCLQILALFFAICYIVDMQLHTRRHIVVTCPSLDTLIMTRCLHAYKYADRKCI